MVSAFILSFQVDAANRCSRFLFQPDHKVYLIPTDFDLFFEEVWIPSSDANTLHAWIIGSRSSSSSKGLVVQLHGTSGNMTGHWAYLRWMVETGYTLLAVDYRGYGKSTGQADFDGAVQDVKAVLEFSETTSRGLGIPLYLFGESIGSTLLFKALETQVVPGNTKALIVEGGFFSPRFVTANLIRTRLPFGIAYSWLSYFMMPSALGLQRGLLSRIQIPTILVHSQSDPVVPISEGHRIYDALGGPKWFLNNAPETHVVGVTEAIRGRFLEILTSLQ